MNIKATHIGFVSLILLSILAIFLAYNSLPEEVATHWNLRGDADQYASKSSLFFFPCALVFIYALFMILPRIDPLKKNIDSFRRYYNAFWLFLAAFLLYLFALTLAWNAGLVFDLPVLMVPGLAAFWYVIGSVLEHSKRNWFLGIRTPWTLSSDRVWEKTHALGGKLFKIAALVSLSGLLLPSGAYVFIAVVGPAVCVALWSVVYSYVIYRKG